MAFSTQASFYIAERSSFPGLGFERCQADPCVFRILIAGEMVVFIVVYVDCNEAQPGTSTKGPLLLLSNQRPRRALALPRMSHNARQNDQYAEVISMSEHASDNGLLRDY